MTKITQEQNMISDKQLGMNVESIDLMFGRTKGFMTTSLELIASQFERGQFVRQLVYNSVDANCTNINVSYEHDDQTNLTNIVFEDDGDGITLSEERHFLTTVGSSKYQGDTSKKGEFGIGFISVFAENPTQVQVETTSKEGSYALLIDSPKTSIGGKIIYSDKPNDATGTVVTMQIEETRAEYEQRENLILSELKMCSGQVKPEIHYQEKEVQ